MTQEELDILNTISNEEDKVKFINECYQKMLDKLDLEPMVQQISDYCNRHIMYEMKKKIWKKLLKKKILHLILQSGN